MEGVVFRPNPQNLLDANNNDDANNTGGNGDTTTKGIYRPPRVAPMPYVPQTSAKTNRQQRTPIPSSLVAVLHTDSSMPHVESTLGLGNTPSLNHTSSRAKYLQHLT
ncbi:hypothetical protein DFJ43DRAFT_1152619 [Lentinula guzmanii]|uniref:Uncharacterized protein n=1 Tax=Lentinula guzmanii TaxID=2804957 RepID=A0AA38JCB2_9AGAR|nr:hypothetical protein DFJ43DRAFT_1152619 [Lentinula guzmanii]